jgi:hypothetical protein
METNLETQTKSLPPTKDIAAGAVVIFRQSVFSGGSFGRYRRKPKFVGYRWVKGLVIRESYGAEKQQHTFTIEVIESDGCDPHAKSHVMRIKGRNLYECAYELVAADQSALDDKHVRGKQARLMRELRKANSLAGVA